MDDGYEPNPEDYGYRTPRRPTVGSLVNEWSTARHDPTLPLLRVLDEQPSCRQDPDSSRWFQGNPRADELAFARRLCADCPAREPCGDYALHHDVSGVWAGTTEAQRKRRRKDLRIKPIPIYGGST